MSQQSNMVRVVLVVVFCAISLAEENSNVNSDSVPVPPGYKSWVSNYRKAVQTITTLGVGGEESEAPEIGNPKFHYRIFMAVLYELGLFLGNMCDSEYDEYYNDAVRKGVDVGWKKNAEVSGLAQNFLENIDKQVKVAVDLIDAKCANPSVGCDHDVAYSIAAEPDKYKKSVEFLQNVNALSEEYLKNTYSSEADTHDIFKTLIEGKQKLKKLVGKLATVVQHGYKRKHFECLAE